MLKKNNRARMKNNSNLYDKARLQEVPERRSVYNFFTTIRFKMIISFSTPIIFIILLGVVSYLNASEGIIGKYEGAASQAINMAGDYLEFGFKSVDATAIQYSNDDSIKKYLWNFYADDGVQNNTIYNTTNNLFKAKQMTDEFISNIYILSDTAKSLSTIPKLSDKGIYTGLMEAPLGELLKEKPMDTLWSGKNSFLDEKLGTLPEQYALRLVRNLPDMKAVLIIDIDEKAVSGIMENLEFDASGIIGIITADHKEIIKGAETNKEATIFIDQNCYKDAIASEAGNGSDYVDYKGKSYLFMYSKIGDTGAVLCGMIPKSIITSQADKIRNTTVIIVLIAIITAVLIGIFISSGIDRIIKDIILKLKQAASGDLTVAFNMKRRDEFHALINEIQSTFLNMKDLIKQVNELSREVSESSKNVKDTSELFLKSTNSISSAMSEVEQGITQQAADAEACLMQMDNLSNKIELVSDNTKEISSIMNLTKGSILKGTNTTEELNQQMKSTIAISSETIKEIEHLAERSLSISKIVNAINDIANQTNLLSLNASIEAARAGEAGKGFSVVASEIRKLAEQSQASVNEIKSIIESIINDTKKAVTSAKKVEKVMELQEKAVNNSTASYQDISENVENLVLQLNNITENVENIENARVSTLGAIENISAVLEEIAASTNSVNQTSTEQLNSIAVLNQSAGGLNANSDNLVSAIQKFKI